MRDLYVQGQSQSAAAHEGSCGEGLAHGATVRASSMGWNQHVLVLL
jgi:hypothetical protein